jgi:predicted acylesterase/phospholipase RssA
MASQPSSCDVVMKGGITSGVVYPKALWILSGQYQFRNVGGASAGAIAAVIAAAAQYGDERSDGRLVRLQELATTITQPRFVERLFQPVKAGRGPYRLLLQFVSDHHRLWWRVTKLYARLLAQIWPAVVMLGAGAWAIWAYGYDGAGALPAILLIALALIVLAPAWPLLRLARVLTRSNGFGLCPGKTQPSNESPALSDWLHAEIQASSGRSVDDPPLTFADLRESEIRLQLMTTDLSAGRPVRLPLAEPNSEPRKPGQDDYLFKPSELDRLLPPQLLTWLDDDKVSPPVDGGYRQLPGMDLPIAVAARLSLSFPILLSAVQLHARKADGAVENRLFSDGGITSNFPIHFFDGWLPTQPTFGLDLIGPDPSAESNIVMPDGPEDPLPRRWTEVGGLQGFAKQIFDSARNWRDTLQMELPGFRERVCHIRLSKEEGGLNLNMSPPTIGALLDRGEEAGYAILAQFSWPHNLWERYRILMALVQANLQESTSRDAWEQCQELLNLPSLDGFPYATDKGVEWRGHARVQTQDLLDEIWGWGTQPTISFHDRDLPSPLPAMHVTPDV